MERGLKGLTKDRRTGKGLSTEHGTATESLVIIKSI